MKEKPSTKQRKEEQKQIKKGTKAWKELQKKNRAEIKANNARFYNKKQQYKKITRINKKKRSRKKNWTF